MKYDFFHTTKAAGRLHVLQTIPDKGDTFPTVIMVSGFGMDLHEGGYFDEISTRLVKQGYQTIRFSFSGVGKSSGKFSATTIDQEALELREIVDLVAKDRFTNVEQIALFAHGFGVAVTIVALPLPYINSFIFAGSQAHPNDVLTRWFKKQRGYNPEGMSEREMSSNQRLAVGPQFWKSLTHHNLVGKIKKIEVPVLFLHGTKDQRVRSVEATTLYAAVTAKKKLHLIEKADHAFTGAFRGPMLRLVTEWLAETLSPQHE